MKNWKVLSAYKKLRSFLELSEYYRRFIPNFERLAKPLRNYTLPVLDDSHQHANQALYALSSAPVLTCADFSKPFILNIDASNVGLGNVLYQKVDGVERVVAYAFVICVPVSANTLLINWSF